MDATSTERAGSIDALCEHLAALPTGPVDKDALLAVLGDAWEKFDGGDEHAMAAYKLDRMEEPSWSPPFLCFDIERHGAIAMGSTYAEVQTWAVDNASRDSRGRMHVSPETVCVGPENEHEGHRQRSSGDHPH